jgi:hypothetical protein
VRRNVSFQSVCPGCNTTLKIEFITEPMRTGAMWTVDCPVCGTSKMVPDEPVRIAYHKDNGWIESAPHTNYSVGKKSGI